MLNYIEICLVQNDVQLIPQARARAYYRFCVAGRRDAGVSRSKQAKELTPGVDNLFLEDDFS